MLHYKPFTAEHSRRPRPSQRAATQHERGTLEVSSDSSGELTDEADGGPPLGRQATTGITPPFPVSQASEQIDNKEGGNFRKEVRV